MSSIASFTTTRTVTSILTTTSTRTRTATETATATVFATTIFTSATVTPATTPIPIVDGSDSDLDDTSSERGALIALATICALLLLIIIGLVAFWVRRRVKYDEKVNQYNNGNVLSKRPLILDEDSEASDRGVAGDNVKLDRPLDEVSESSDRGVAADNVKLDRPLSIFGSDLGRDRPRLLPRPMTFYGVEGGSALDQYASGSPYRRSPSVSDLQIPAYGQEMASHVSVDENGERSSVRFFFAALMSGRREHRRDDRDRSGDWRDDRRDDRRDYVRRDGHPYRRSYSSREDERHPPRSRDEPQSRNSYKSHGSDSREQRRSMASRDDTPRRVGRPRDEESGRPQPVETKPPNTPVVPDVTPVKPTFVSPQIQEFYLDKYPLVDSAPQEKLLSEYSRNVVAWNGKMTKMRKLDFELDMLMIESHKWNAQAKVLEDTINDIDQELKAVASA
ncbi:MAG: hypothetical protein SGCHY_000232 [Lobulomycetales sp.]